MTIKIDTKKLDYNLFEFSYNISKIDSKYVLLNIFEEVIDFEDLNDEFDIKLIDIFANTSGKTVIQIENHNFDLDIDFIYGLPEKSNDQNKPQETLKFFKKVKKEFNEIILDRNLNKITTETFEV